ncbi:ERF family protein [Shouchella lehensis]|uniref:Single-stranded DNA-binding protein n=1 Tax=Shouchella lehensis TaxID=300825 RepID=A0A4Y7WEH4_9BACI|nr:ERF family protein [Shouchella lehensis]MBG9783567.1 hypothetical protein [Shouchella lehensis]TES45679.1 single-stranded DNA-binding protein [Shouchella lehensis]
MEKNLHQKLVEIRKSIASLKKDGSSHGYTYVKGEQLLTAIKEKMDELEVILMPQVNDQSHSTYDYTTSGGKDKTDFIVTASMRYVWINASEPQQTLEIPWQLLGQQDDISKAFGSGLTYSERYFLLKFFGVPTDSDDPDSGENTKRIKGSSSFNNGLASQKQKNYLKKLLVEKQKKNGTTSEIVWKTLQKRIEVQKSLDQFTSHDASKAIEYLQVHK